MLTILGLGMIMCFMYLIMSKRLSALVALTLIAKGEVFSTDNIVAKRAGGSGISPIYYGEVFGKTASKAFHIDELISI